ncbi:MAG: hypothetical protein ACFE8L_13820, partial [Candidatus Hodarchaeota archaeon]
MKEKAFMKYLLENNVTQEQAIGFVSRLNEFNNYLGKKDLNVDSIPTGGILEYTEYLIEHGSEKVLELLIALYHYAHFAKKYEYIIEITDIEESSNAIDNLYLRIAEQFDEKIRDEIFEDLDIPPLGVDPDKKPEFTKEIMKRLEEKLGVEETIKLLTPCLHGRPLEPIKRDREDFLRLNDIDEFLTLKKQELIERVQKHQKEGTL